MAMKLEDIFPIENTGDYKIHFAKSGSGGNSEPLEDWVKDKNDYQKKRLEKHGLSRDEFKRQYIFSLMRFYHEEDTWLFGGVFEVQKRHQNSKGLCVYKVKRTSIGKGLIGRLRISYVHRDGFSPRVNMESHYSELKVKEILPEQYSGLTFPGFEDIDLSFSDLETVLDKKDWKVALENIKGIYLVTDTKTNKRYVGSAYGEGGVWGRWKNYLKTGHGGNKMMKELVKNKKTKDRKIEYFRRNFRFALLEHRSFKSDDKKIIERENYWKEILLTREKMGLNHN
jgi:hypothetical protein